MFMSVIGEAEMPGIEPWVKTFGEDFL